MKNCPTKEKKHANKPSSTKYIFSLNFIVIPLVYIYTFIVSVRYVYF